jgi:CO/xanthine dehydrogenase FAD-binding subunit
MKPAPFTYLAARSIEEALALKAQHGGEAMFLAGGQSLMPMLNFRLAQPAVLIDINAVPDCDGVRLSGGELRVGALTRYRALQASADIAAHAPLIADALPLIAHPQIRNRGTIGGNLSHADPASELPAATVALDARMRLRSSTGERWIAAESFFTGALATALAPDEMLAEIAWPAARPGDGRAFLEVSRRQGDYAMMGVAAVVSLDANARCTRARLAFCAAGDGPVLATNAAAALIGGALGADAIAAAAALAGTDIDPGGTIHATPDFQRHLARVLTARALRMARDRAQASLPGHKGKAA